MRAPWSRATGRPVRSRAARTTPISSGRQVPSPPSAGQAIPAYETAPGRISRAWRAASSMRTAVMLKAHRDTRSTSRISSPMSSRPRRRAESRPTRSPNFGAGSTTSLRRRFVPTSGSNPSATRSTNHSGMPLGRTIREPTGFEAMARPALRRPRSTPRTQVATCSGVQAGSRSPAWPTPSTRSGSPMRARRHRMRTTTASASRSTRAASNG